MASEVVKKVKNGVALGAELINDVTETRSASQLCTYQCRRGW